MAKAHFVKSARTDHPGGIKKGEPYYWWAFMVGGRGGPKRYSKTPPKRWQLTQSEFFSTLYRIEDDVLGSIEAKNGDDIPGMIEDAVSQLRELAEETQGKLDNLPEGLQQGEPGNLLQERIDACNNAADELEQIDTDASSKDDGTNFEEFWQNVVDQVQAVSVDAP